MQTSMEALSTDYRLDAVGVLAWLYWRENDGRLPWALFDGRAYV